MKSEIRCRQDFDRLNISKMSGFQKNHLLIEGLAILAVAGSISCNKPENTANTIYISAPIEQSPVVGPDKRQVSIPQRNFPGCEFMSSDNTGTTETGQAFGISFGRETRNGQAFLIPYMNIVTDTPTNWLVYQYINSRNYLLNPHYSEGSNARYSGVVLRGARITDGTRGDIVASIYGNRAIPSNAHAGNSELSPVVEVDGSVLPLNVVLRLQNGKLYPDCPTLSDSQLGEASIRTDSTNLIVPDFAPTTVVAYWR